MCFLHFNTLILWVLPLNLWFGNHTGSVCALGCLPSLDGWVMLSDCCGESRVWLGVEVGMLVRKDEQILVCGKVGEMVLGMAKFGGQAPTETFSEVTQKK